MLDSGDRWHTTRTWPGGGWGDALAQVRKAQKRKAQRLTQKDVADYVGVGLATVRKWEDGLALPERSMWPKLEEAMGLPVPDPRVPERTPAERELIDTMLMLVDELRLLREKLGELKVPTPTTVADREPNVLDVDQAAEHLGISPSTVRGLAYQRKLVHYKVGRRVKFRRDDLDKFIEDGKRDLAEYVPWQLQGRAGKSPRKSK